MNFNEKENMQTQTGFIPESTLETRLKQLVPINRHAKKLNFNDFTIERTGAFEDRNMVLTHVDFDGNEKNHSEIIRWVEIIVTGDDVIIGDWKFLAQIDHQFTEEQKYVNIVNNFTNIPVAKQYINVAPNCEHCNHKRTRSKTYIVQHVKTGEMKQVGSTCVKDFTGYANPNSIFNFFAKFDSFRMDIFDEEQYYTGGYSFDQRYDTEDYTRIAIEFIINNGFKSRNKCEFDESPTSDYVRDEMKIWMSQHTSHPEYAEKNFSERGAKLFKYAFSEYLDNLKNSDRNDFEEQMYAFLSDKSFPQKSGGIMTYVAFDIKQKFEKAQQPKRDPSKSIHVGELKQRFEREVTMVYSGEYYSQFTDSQLPMYRFLDADGNIFIWFASNWNFDMEVNTTTSVKMTVKKHDTYKGTKQTYVNRVAMVKNPTVKPAHIKM